MIPPFDEDVIICRAAELSGLTLSRYEAIEVTDLAALKAAKLTRETADYSRIRKLLSEGAEVAGARLAGIEYKLRRPTPC